MDHFTAVVDYDPGVTPGVGTLNMNTSVICFTFTSLDDSLVEGNEEVLVRFSFVNRIGSFVRLRDGEAIIAIADNDCKSI